MRKRLLIIILPAILVFAVIACIMYDRLLADNVEPDGERAEIYIPEGASYQQAMDSVRAKLRIRNPAVLEWFSERKGYTGLVRPGRYVVDKPLGYNELINILRGGRQSPVRVTFSNVRTIYELAGRIGGKIEADSASIVHFFSDPDNYSGDGFTSETIISVFIPDTYEFYWNTDPPRLYNRMLREYRKFWNDERMQKSSLLNLTPAEVSTLASIVDHEALKADEKPRIAGVYVNRLKRGMPLQADPTIKFAVNDFTLNRVLNRHLEVDSPYNTYRNPGLPPGPISCPSIEGIDAVLNAEEHDYLYFAAKADFSGYHNFSRTLSEHNRYANEYRQELNRRKIYR
ncbi:MAG: endolytic transglycosylase MltG [Bacteroidales bacterium]|jgi:UPF0755 protein|nr:endolytic transglycosylase MltG [Bacteroidales bacterium]